MAFGGFEKQNTTPMAEINTTPFVDVMLVLLIIFIVTAPLVTNVVNVNLPQTKSQASPQKPNIIKVAIDANGQLFWNGKKTTLNDLPALFKNSSKNNDTELHLEADQNSRYQEIADIMVEAKKAGITKLGFVSKAQN